MNFALSMVATSIVALQMIRTEGQIGYDIEVSLKMSLEMILTNNAM